MKKWLFGLTFLIVLLLLVANFVLKIPPWHLGEAVRVGTGLGAKLACSGRYLSGFSEQQILDDLKTYSPANAYLDLVYDQTNKRATATLFGMAETSATYRPGLGCSLDIGNTRNLDTVVVPDIESTQQTWPAGSTVSEVDHSIQRKLDTLLAQDNESGLDTRALLVVKDGKLVAESYSHFITADTQLLGWSMGKSLTAMMLGFLELKGYVNVAETGVFPEWKDDDRAGISIENLLQMSTGLDFNEVYIPGSDSTRMLFLSHSASDVALNSPLKHAPGEEFSYSSGTTNLLSRLFYERTGGKTQDAVNTLYTEFFAPLGMADSTFEPDPSGVFVGSSYIYASARDWARLGQLLLNDGELNGQRLLPKGWAYRAAMPNNSKNDSRYGYQFWLNNGKVEDLRWDMLPADSYAMNGNRSQVVMMIPSENLVVVRLGWTSGWYPTGRKFAEVLSWF